LVEDSPARREIVEIEDDVARFKQVPAWSYQKLTKHKAQSPQVHGGIVR
jgi:hypothetical protein